MKKLLLCLSISLSLFSNEFKTFDMLAPEYKNYEQVKNGIYDIKDDADFNKMVDFQKKNGIYYNKTDNKPIVAPARRNQPAVELYVYKPDNMKPNEKLPLLYFTHGGGYVLGNATRNLEDMKKMANENRVIGVSVEYRLASKEPFPADINDAYYGLKYLVDNASRLNIDKDRIIVMGESAGGGLAARLALMVRDKKEFNLKGQILVYPMLDYRTGTDDSPYKNDYTGEFVWTRASNRYGWNKLRGNKNISEAEMPYFSPALAKNLAGLPETYMIAGTLDLFVNEDIDYANRLNMAGVPVELQIIPGVYHAFEKMIPDSPQAKKYFETRREFINRIIKK